MAEAQIDIDDEIPEVSNEAALAWLDEQILRGKQLVAKKMTQARAIQTGEIPPAAFGDPKEFEVIKRSIGIKETLRTGLIGLVGSAAGVPAEDVDEVFFEILSASRGYDVTGQGADRA